jgi:hypothetical protein
MRCTTKEDLNKSKFIKNKLNYKTHKCRHYINPNNDDKMSRIIEEDVIVINWKYNDNITNYDELRDTLSTNYIYYNNVKMIEYKNSATSKDNKKSLTTKNIKSYSCRCSKTYV